MARGLGANDPDGEFPREYTPCSHGLRVSVFMKGGGRNLDVGRRVRSGFEALCFMAIFAPIAQAQEASEIQTTPDQPTPSTQMEAFEDWRVLCQSEEGRTICQMLQSASVAEDGTEAFLLSISPDQDGGTSSAVVTVPIGVYLAHGIEIRVDQRRPFKVLYEVCDRSGCHAGFKLSGAALSAFKQGLNAKVRVWTSQSQAVEFPFSLRGFSAAYSHYRSEISG